MEMTQEISRDKKRLLKEVNILQNNKITPPRKWKFIIKSAIYQENLYGGLIKCKII